MLGILKLKLGICQFVGIAAADRTAIQDVFQLFLGGVGVGKLAGLEYIFQG